MIVTDDDRAASVMSFITRSAPLNSILFTLYLALILAHPAAAQTQAAPSSTPAPISHKMCVDPSESSVSLGKAYLTVNPLVLTGKFYTGDYQLKVVPYFFMSETGALQLNVPADLSGTTAADFTGTASNNKHGKPKIITGKITPSTPTQGNVTFSVETDNGRMIFNTSYHFAD
jgi:hypothetical protein